MIGAGMAPKVLNFVFACPEIILQALSSGTPRRRQSKIEGGARFPWKYNDATVFDVWRAMTEIMQ